MSSDDYQVQNIYRYSRKSYKKVHRDQQDNDVTSPRENIEVSELSPRSEERNDGPTLGSPGCSCDMDSEGEIAHILHKKCAVITLAQQQLQKLLDGTDKLLCDDTRCCRSVYDLLCFCKDIVLKYNRYQCALLFLMAMVCFAGGALIGAATCGSYLGRFDSPVLTCIENFFIRNTFASVKDSYYSIT